MSCAVSVLESRGESWLEWRDRDGRSRITLSAVVDHAVRVADLHGDRVWVRGVLESDANDVRCPLASNIAALAQTAVAAPSRPAIRVTEMRPLRVVGSGFRAHESLRLMVAFGARALKRRLSTSSNGTFVASFGTVSEDRCNGGGMLTVFRADGTEVVRKVSARACPAVMPAPVPPAP
jgi:hypothetical protein